MDKVYLVVIVRQCGTDVWSVYADRERAENLAEWLQHEKERGIMQFDFCHVVQRPFAL